MGQGSMGFALIDQPGAILCACRGMSPGGRPPSLPALRIGREHTRAAGTGGRIKR